MGANVTPGQGTENHSSAQNFTKQTEAPRRAGGDVQAVHRLQPIVTLRGCDVDGGWEEDGDVHRNDGSRPVCQEKEVT